MTTTRVRRSLDEDSNRTIDRGARRDIGSALDRPLPRLGRRATSPLGGGSASGGTPPIVPRRANVTGCEEAEPLSASGDETVRRCLQMWSQPDHDRSVGVTPTAARGASGASDTRLTLHHVRVSCRSATPPSLSWAVETHRPWACSPHPNTSVLQLEVALFSQTGTASWSCAYGSSRPIISGAHHRPSRARFVRPDLIDDIGAQPVFDDAAALGPRASPTENSCGRVPVTIAVGEESEFGASVRPASSTTLSP